MISLSISSSIFTLSSSAAAQVAALMSKIVAERGVFHLGLAGGRTPMTLYQILTTAPYADLPWNKVHIWFSDERMVPPHHPDSNFRMARESLLNHISIPGHQIHPMPSDLINLRHGALEYTRRLESLLLCRDGIPSFDLLLLGMGTDGHIASLFPGSCALHQIHQAVVAVYAPGPRAWRITLTRPVINYAHHLLLLAAGADKAAAVAQAFIPNPSPPLLPIQRLAPQGEVIWYLDAAAASLLPINSQTWLTAQGINYFNRSEVEIN